MGRKESTMRLPSIKTIRDRIERPYRLPDGTAEAIRSILECRTVEAVCELNAAASRMFGACYHRPSLQSVKLEAINGLMDGCGVEYIQAGSNKQSPAIEYINVGDTYSATIMWTRGRYVVGCWGDIVERGSYA
jgi:hypothetical protein